MWQKQISYQTFNVCVTAETRLAGAATSQSSTLSHQCLVYFVYQRVPVARHHFTHICPAFCSPLWIQNTPPG